MDGIRESKTVDGVEHRYVTLDGMVVRETYGNITIDYLYDNEGRPYKIVVDENGTTYTGCFVLNQQGDVIALLDGSGNVVVEYSYDAWGRPDAPICTGDTGTKLGQYNALRYRGYYYDAETGFYYLNSRYYDPVIGRFISADTIDVLCIEQGNLLQYNFYTYCLNNPVNTIDSEGTLGLTLSAAIGGALAGAILSTASYAIGCVMNGEEMDAKGWAMAAVTGAVCGGVGGALGMATIAVKLVGSIGVGIFAGVVTGISSGSAGKGIAAGIAAAQSCFLGSFMEFEKNVLTTMLATGVSSIVIGTPIEIASLAAQSVVSDNASSTSGSAGSVKSAGRTQRRSNRTRNDSYAYRPLGRWTMMSDLYGEDWRAHYEY